jgi:hypothetical protein
VLLSTLLCGSPWFNIAFNFLYMKYPQTSQHRNHRSGDAGFALVIALGLMAFVLLLLLSITTLVEVSVRGADAQKQLTLARQNALLGVQVALGQLQTEMGPDRRISATASLLDEDPQTDVIEGVGQPSWTGAWDSDQWDRSSQVNAPVSGLTSASDGKPLSFRAWLVSGVSDASLTATERLAIAQTFSATSANAVQLVGEGTLGAVTAVELAQQSVYAPRRDVAIGSMVGGGYAYWVGDEGVKARYGNPVVEAAVSPDQKLLAVTTLDRPNLQSMEGWADFTGAYSSVEKVIGYNHLEAVVEDDLSDGSAFDGKYHAITPYSLGLLTDARTGGFKRDLSLLFGGTTLPAEYRDVAMYEFGSAQGANWDYVKRYHNRYTLLDAESDGTASFNILDVKPEAETPSSGGTKAAGDTPMPVVVRIQYLFSLYQGYNTINGLPVAQLPAGTPLGSQSDEQIVYLMVTPVIYLWNPYNVAIEMPQDRQAALNLLPGYLQLEFSLDDGSTYLPLERMFWVNAGELFSMNTSNVGQNDGGQAFTIPPGEMVINSLKPLEYGQKMAVFYSDREAFFGADEDDINGDPYQFSRIQDMEEGFDESSMGFFTFKMKEQTPGGDLDTMKQPATGSAEIRLRFNPTASKFIFKTSIGGEYADRNPAGVMNMNSPSAISATYTPVEYIHADSVPLASLPPMLQGGGFSGLAPLFALNYDVRAFEDTTSASDPRIGKPGFFTDPTNGYYYYEEADEKAFAMAPFRFWFEAITENPVQVDEDTGRAAYRTQSGDLIYSNVAKELPVAPLLSIAQLEHAPLGRDYQHHAYQFSQLGWTSAVEDLSPASSERRNMAPEFNRPVGNSVAHPLIAADSIWDGGYGVDKSYVLNDLLFDSYFFSGITDQAGPFFSAPLTAQETLQGVIDGSGTFANNNYRFVLPADLDEQEVRDLLLPQSASPSQDPFAILAAFIAVEGAFNINSTSADAWASLLSSIRGKAVQYENLDPQDTGYKEDLNAELTPVLSQAVPAGPAAESLSSSTLAYAALWSGYRSLSDAQIRMLAEKLVEQVKARGPFLSLSQFINREVSTRSPYNQMGAMQAAIDATKINTESEKGSFESSLQSRFKSNQMPMSGAGLLAAGFEFPEALEGDLNDGATGYVTQSQLLRPLAPIMTARSDTFVIRSYGDVTVNGEVVATVWCEVVAQRNADYVGSDVVALAAWDEPTAGSISERFGRGFKILSFQWLSPADI